MREERKKSVWPWIIAMLIGLPMLYVASFGPACWLGRRNMISAPVVKAAYRPIINAMFRGPQPVQDALFLYASRFDSMSFMVEIYIFEKRGP